MSFLNNRMTGIILVFFGATFWGIGGTAADYLFTYEGIDVNWYVAARLIVSGILLLGIQSMIQSTKSVFLVWKDSKMRWHLIIFSIFGMLLVQYSYMASIEAGNAAIATLLQYLAPIYIIIWMVFRKQAKLTISDIISINLTVVGTWLLLTNGSLQSLSVPTSAVIWGIISGLSLAYYTLYAKKLLSNFSSLSIVGWAMIVAGICMSFIHPVWNVDTNHWSLSTVTVLLFTIIVGTALAFWMFIASLKYLQAKETTLIGTVEPLAAVVSSMLWLNLAFGSLQAVGMVLIITLVIYLSLQKTA